MQEPEVFILKKWVLFTEPKIKWDAMLFINKLQKEALDYNFEIMDPLMKTYDPVDRVINELENLLNNSYIQQYHLIMVILPKTAPQTYFSKVKILCHKFSVPSQMMLSSTLMKNMPYDSIILSIRTKAMIAKYENQISQFSQYINPVLNDNLDANFSPKMRGIIEKPHKPRYESNEGTEEVVGYLKFEDDDRETSERLVIYDRVSLVNLPTFYAGDRVTFGVRIDEARSTFRVQDLTLDLEASQATNPRERMSGTVIVYNDVTHTGKICNASNDMIQFKTDECLQKGFEEFVPDDVVEFSIVSQVSYYIAVRIVKSYSHDTS